MRYETSVDVAAPADLVARVLLDVERWPEWTASVREVRPLDGPGLRPGARFRVRQPRLPPMTWRVVEVAAGRSFAWEYRALGSVTLADHVATPTSETSCRVAMTIVARGVLVPVLAPLTRGLTLRYMAMEAAGLKARCERDYATGRR